MKLINILLFSFALMSGCSHELSSMPATSLEKISDWNLINKISNEKWHKEKIIDFFGNPDKILNEKPSYVEYLIYNDSALKIQKWSFEIKEKSQLSHVTFIPNISNRVLFTVEQVMLNWGKECQKKTDIDLKQHFLKKVYFLDCGSSRRAYLNLKGEVTSLSIKVK